jgi:four helix bundle protein
MGSGSYRDLKVWHTAMEVAVETYGIVENFPKPKEETYGLALQMKKSAVSIPSNIAEGYRRRTRKDFRKFLTIAFGSGAELETQIEISQRVSWGRSLDFDRIISKLGEVMRMLNSLIKKLN